MHPAEEAKKGFICHPPDVLESSAVRWCEHPLYLSEAAPIISALVTART